MTETQKMIKKLVDNECRTSVELNGCGSLYETYSKTLEQAMSYIVEYVGS